MAVIVMWNSKLGCESLLVIRMTMFFFVFMTLLESKLTFGETVFGGETHCEKLARDPTGTAHELVVNGKRTLIENYKSGLYEASFSWNDNPAVRRLSNRLGKLPFTEVEKEPIEVIDARVDEKIKEFNKTSKFNGMIFKTTHDEFAILL